VHSVRVVYSGRKSWYNIRTDLEKRKRSKRRLLAWTRSSLSLHHRPRQGAALTPSTTGTAARLGVRLPVWFVHRCPWCPRRIFQTGYNDDINASLTQNQCLQCVTPPLTHVEINLPRLRDAIELNIDGMIKLGDVHYQTEPNLSIYPKKT